MPLDEMPTFMHALGAYDGDLRTRLALRLMVLTFARTTELRAARWPEFENLDGNEPVWRIPAERTKMKREHLVPLAPQALAVLRELRELPGSDASLFLFPSASLEKCMSNNTMLYALYRMGYHGRATVHGFRAMASTALNEMGFRPDVIERQLAHEEKNAVRAAYNRAEYLNERRTMMDQWADYIDAVWWSKCHSAAVKDPQGIAKRNSERWPGRRTASPEASRDHFHWSRSWFVGDPQCRRDFGRPGLILTACRSSSPITHSGLMRPNTRAGCPFPKVEHVRSEMFSHLR